MRNKKKLRGAPVEKHSCRGNVNYLIMQNKNKLWLNIRKIFDYKSKQYEGNENLFIFLYRSYCRIIRLFMKAKTGCYRLFMTIIMLNILGWIFCKQL